MYQEIPFVITGSDNKVILNSIAAAKKYRSVTFHTDLSRYFGTETKNILSLLSFESSAMIELKGLKKTKYAYVRQRSNSGISYRIFIFLDTDAKQTALLDLPAKFVCNSVKRELSSLCGEEMTPELYEIMLGINNVLSDTTVFTGSEIREYRLDELILDIEDKARKMDLAGCSLHVVYENVLPAELGANSSASAFAFAVLFLLSAAAQISADKNIVLSVSFYDGTLSFAIRTETEIGAGQILRDREIFETDLFDEDVFGVLSLCSYMSGAFCGRLAVSVDGTKEKTLIHFEYAIKNYDKRLADIKADLDIYEDR